MNLEALKKAKVTFIGAGNMAEALVNGLISGGVCAAGQIVVSDLRAERLELFREKFGVEGTANNLDAVRDAGVVVLSVKPQSFPDVLKEIGAALCESGALVVSIAAGVRTGTIEQTVGGACRVVRVMPNTPALVGAGAAALCRGAHARDDDLDVVEVMLGSVGAAVRVDEGDMDAVTALSGSGPAYVFLLIEAMQEAARRLGLSPEVATHLILATVVGSAKLCEGTGLPAGELRERVTSKGGTTAAALEVLRDRKMYEAVVDAIQAAQKRSVELSQA